jgi:hypothetical protein
MIKFNVMKENHKIGEKVVPSDECKYKYIKIRSRKIPKMSIFSPPI